MSSALTCDTVLYVCCSCRLLSHQCARAYAMTVLHSNCCATLGPFLGRARTCLSLCRQHLSSVELLTNRTGVRRRLLRASRQGGMGQKSSKAPQVEARYLAPQKLYCYSEVDLRKLRKLIKDRKLAPCFPGVDSESREVVILFRYACRLAACDELL